MKKLSTDNMMIAVLIVVAAFARIINAQMHLPHYAPLIAISVFGVALIREKRYRAFLIPILGQFLADAYFSLFTAIPGFYSLSGMFFNYGGLLLAAALGLGIKMKPLSAIGTTLGAALVFFLVSNFGYFLQGWNGYSFTGLAKTYVDGVPFFKYTLEGNVVCALVLFGGWFAFQQLAAKKTQKVTI